MRSSRTTTNLRRLSLTARMVVGNVSSQMVDWRCCEDDLSSQIGFLISCRQVERTFVLTICSRLVED
jgi:hypothetical protein